MRAFGLTSQPSRLLAVTSQSVSNAVVTVIALAASLGSGLVPERDAPSLKDCTSTSSPNTALPFCKLTPTWAPPRKPRSDMVPVPAAATAGSASGPNGQFSPVGGTASVSLHTPEVPACALPQAMPALTPR